MKKGWKIILVIVLVVIFIGALCIGVGMLTGSDSARIYSVLDEELSLTEAYNTYSDYAVSVGQAVMFTE